MFEPEPDEDDCSICIEFRAWFHELFHSTFDFIHWIAHTCYFAAVWTEGHGFYAICGAALLAITIVGLYYNNE